MSKIKALLVEDDLMVQRVQSMMLMQDGFEVASAENAEKAINLSNQTKFDVIFMDVGLPDATGFEVIKKIKNGDGLNKTTAIFVLTAHSDKSYEDQARLLEAAGFFVKPLDSEKVNQVKKILFRE